MDISKGLVTSYFRHTKILIEKGKFDLKDIKTANALRLARKELIKLERILNNDCNK